MKTKLVSYSKNNNISNVGEINKEVVTKGATHCKTMDEETLLYACIYNIILTNDLMCSTLIESVDELKKTELYKFKTKKLCKMVDKERASYEKKMGEIFTPDLQVFFADANDVVADEVGQYVDKLFFQFKSVLDKMNISDSFALAKVMVADAMIQLSVTSWDRRIEEMGNTVAGVAKRLSYLKMERLLHLHKELILSINVSEHIDLNNDITDMTMEIIMKKLVDGDLISEAMKLNKAS